MRVNNYERSFYFNNNLGKGYWTSILIGVGSSVINNSSTLIFPSILIEPSLTVVEFTIDVFKFTRDGSISFTEVSYTIFYIFTPPYGIPYTYY